MRTVSRGREKSVKLLFTGPSSLRFVTAAVRVLRPRHVLEMGSGLSTRLLNRDHSATYFADAPLDTTGKPLRRHGDELERLSDGRYRVAGRSDDTMNLGGIKVGCVEIERVVNGLPTVHETAAVAVSPPGGGPSQLVIFTVAKPGAATVYPYSERCSA